MNQMDACNSELTYTLLYANGEADRKAGIELFTGWREIAEVCGFDPTQRTPAMEAYQDGWFMGVPRADSSLWKG